ncbi:partial acetylornithine deacetylase, partial [Burkholderiales bacterium]
MNAAIPGESTLALLERLVSFDTTSRESNLALIHWVRDYLADFGVDSRLTFDDTGAKANLFATLGPAGDGGIVLSGHTDVVPVDGQPWTVPPFALTRCADRLLGRGVCDMKGFIATALAFVPIWLKQGLRRPLHLAFSYDEEVGCIGVRRLLADLAGCGLRPGGCVVGEPTGMQVIVAHKGRQSYRCRVRGKPGHSARPEEGVNAIHIACELVTELARLAKKHRELGPFDTGFDVPYSTMQAGVIQGGTACNIIPRDCSFEFELRNLPLDDPAAILAALQYYAEHKLLPEMLAVDPGTGITWETISDLPAFDSGAESSITHLAHECSASTGVSKVSYAAEASLFDRAGMPTVLCGPGHIAQAHQPDEWVALEQLALCEAFMRRL